MPRRKRPSAGESAPKQGGERHLSPAVRRAQILSAALALFSERGYAGTSTARIAKAAGIAEGLLFHYFPTKEALLLELAARHNTFAARAFVSLQGADRKTARELLRSVADGLGDMSAEERQFVGFMFAEAQVNPLLRSQVVSATNLGIEACVKALAERVTAGELRPDAPLDSAVLGFFGGFMFFLGQHRHLGQDAWQQQATQFARHWAEVCWRGLASPSATTSNAT